MPVVIKQTTKIPLFANANKKILEGAREFSGKKVNSPPSGLCYRARN